MSDQSLRELLLLEDSQIPSKLKFEVEGRLKVRIDINNKQNFGETLFQDEVKYFYDKFPLSTIRVDISGDGEKLLSVDGSEGKVMTRSHNIEVEDIDAFIEKLSILIEYDYLNQSYQGEMLNRANYKLTTTQSLKEMIVKTCYKEIENKIKIYHKDSTGVFIKLLQNAFFYCMKNRIYFVPSTSSMDYPILDSKVEGYLSKLNDVDVTKIKNTFYSLLELYLIYHNELRELMQAIDKLINSSPGLISNASSL